MVVADAAANKAENNDDATILVRVSTEGRLIVVLDVFPLSFLGRKGVERMSVEKDGKKYRYCSSHLFGTGMNKDSGKKNQGF